MSRADFIKLMEHAEIHGDDRYAVIMVWVYAVMMGVGVCCDDRCGCML